MVTASLHILQYSANIRYDVEASKPNGCQGKSRPSNSSAENYFELDEEELVVAAAEVQELPTDVDPKTAPNTLPMLQNENVSAAKRRVVRLEYVRGVPGVNSDPTL